MKTIVWVKSMARMWVGVAMHALACICKSSSSTYTIVPKIYKSTCIQQYCYHSRNVFRMDVHTRLLLPTVNVEVRLARGDHKATASRQSVSESVCVSACVHVSVYVHIDMRVDMCKYIETEIQIVHIGKGTYWKRKVLQSPKDSLGLGVVLWVRAYTQTDEHRP